MGDSQFNTLLQILLFADDMVLIAESPAELQRLVSACTLFASANCFEFNSAKTKCQAFGPGRRPFNLMLDGVEVEQVTTFRFLGVMLQSDCGWSEHKALLLLRARTAMRSCLPWHGDAQKLPLRIKIDLFKAEVRPHLEYVC